MCRDYVEVQVIAPGFHYPDRNRQEDAPPDAEPPFEPPSPEPIHLPEPEIPPQPEPVEPE